MLRSRLKVRAGPSIAQSGDRRGGVYGNVDPDRCCGAGDGAQCRSDGIYVGRPVQQGQVWSAGSDCDDRRQDQAGHRVDRVGGPGQRQRDAPRIELRLESADGLLRNASADGSSGVRHRVGRLVSGFGSSGDLSVHCRTREGEKGARPQRLLRDGPTRCRERRRHSRTAGTAG
jgi:hypothetical protein